MRVGQMDQCRHESKWTGTQRPGRHVCWGGNTGSSVDTKVGSVDIVSGM